MKVIEIAYKRKTKLIELFYSLAAKVEEDGPFDVAMCIMDNAGKEHVLLTGRYERDAGALSMAGFQLQYEAMVAAANDPRIV